MGRKAAFSILCLVLAATPAVAQERNPVRPQEPSTRSGMSTATRAENVNALQELAAFGRCFARFNRNVALGFVATESGSRGEAEYFERFIGGERPGCRNYGSWTNASFVYWRGVIAEGLLHSGGVPASHVLPAPTVEQVSNLHDVARCYAAGHREQVRGLLATRLGSPEETAAVAALWNDFRACMPANFNVRLNAPWIRFLLAEALLRLAPETTLAGN